MGILSVETFTGTVTVEERDGAIVRLSWGIEDAAPSALVTAAVEQLRAYCAGELTSFDLPLDVGGSAFQKDVCAAMYRIPFGEVLTYGDLAEELNSAAQPIGNACGANPIPIIIPCHRVLGSSGLGGFSGRGGVETKVALLRHEGAAGLLI